MTKNSKSKNGYIHLYNPKEEGLGEYDTNYINAYRKNKRFKENLIKEERGRFAA